MATALKIPEESFRQGCGRYIQKSGSLACVGQEIKKLGARSPFILGGKTTLSLTQEKVLSSLQTQGITPYFHIYTGFCCKEICAEIMQTQSFQNAEVVFTHILYVDSTIFISNACIFDKVVLYSKYTLYSKVVYEISSQYLYRKR